MYKFFKKIMEDLKMYKFFKKIKEHILYIFYYKPIIKKMLKNRTGLRKNKRKFNNLNFLNPPTFDEKIWTKIIYRSVLLNKRMMENDEKIKNSKSNDFLIQHSKDQMEGLKDQMEGFKDQRKDERRNNEKE